MLASTYTATPNLESEVQQRGQELWRDVEWRGLGRFDARHWHTRIMNWIMRDDGLRTSVLHLVDVLPALSSAPQIIEHSQDYLLEGGREFPWYIRDALRVAGHEPVLSAVAALFGSQVRSFGRRFIAGPDVAKALPSLRRLHYAGYAFTADLLGEATLGRAEAEDYERRYRELALALAKETSTWPELKCFAGRRPAAPLANISVKLSALDPSLKPADPAGGAARLYSRLLPLMLRCKALNVFVNVDLEQWALHEITYSVFERVMLHPDLSTWPHAGIVVQAYLKHAAEDVERLVSLAKRRGAPIIVRLVKGAYWDYEVAHAQQNGFKCPVYVQKGATDANFERLSAQLLDRIDDITPAFGSHNLRSLSNAIVQAEKRDILPTSYEIQMLHGMAEPEREVIRTQGYCVRLYTPIGELIPGMAYLVRRLLENTSNHGFLRQAHWEGVDMNELLQSPQLRNHTSARKRAEAPSEAHFENCPLSDFTNPALRERMELALQYQVESFPHLVPVVVDGEGRTSGPVSNRNNPSDYTVTVARVASATEEECDNAVSVASKAYPLWRVRPLQERADLLYSLAYWLDTRRMALAALVVHEVGKPWAEADADVAEAIDYCRYYADRAVVELTPQSLPGVAGERNRLLFEGRGPTVVIAPWNFPLAIPCGMAAAALVAGNPVIIKPAEQASATAYALYEQMRDTCFPGDVVQFLPGGGNVGSYLVDHPQVATVAFTGSSQVGASILERVGRVRADQPEIKKAICEMGGKNAIVVDEDADLDEAVAGVIQSAFGFAGQKCSACSRAIIVGKAYGPFRKRLVDAAQSLITAPAQDPACELGPVIDARSQARLMKMISNPPPGTTPVYVGSPREGGYYAPAAILGVDDPAHPLMQNELFGPILTVMKVDTFEHALDVALASTFALTGAVFSRLPKHLEMATLRFRVGNLYLNRGCTGARVGRQPFGGVGMSGDGAKAGGPGYLRLFVNSRCVTENTMRHGFAPEVSA